MKLAVIPARGGSKRIPLKNIVNFHGRPIIAWSIEAALQSGCFDEVIVSTDSLQIADIARKYGASVPFMRPVELSDDHTGTVPVIKHAIEWFRAQGRLVDQACCVYATAPLIDPADIERGLKILNDKGCDYVFTATTFSYAIQRAFRVNSDGRTAMFYPEFGGTRSQDLEEAWHDAGQFYWGQASAWCDGKRILESDSVVLPIPRTRAHDIDTPEDLERLELMFSATTVPAAAKGKRQSHRTFSPSTASLHAAGLTSKLSLGTVQLGMEYGIANETGQVSPEEGAEVLGVAWQSGVRALDTAIAYGDSEAVLGRIGVQDWAVVTKLPHVPDSVPDVWEWVKEQVSGSFSRLCLQRVDTVLLHQADQLLAERGAEIRLALYRLKAEGFAAKVGVSVYSPEQLSQVFDKDIFDVVQAPSSILDRRLVETGWALRLNDLGVELHTRSVFLQGLLLMTDRERPQKFKRWDSIWRTWSSWLEDTGLSALEACLMYSLSIPEASKVVVGVDSASQLQSLLQVSPRELPHLPKWPEMPSAPLLDPSRWSAL